MKDNNFVDLKLIELKNYTHSFSLKNKISRVLWNITYCIFFRPVGFKVFKSIFNNYRNFILRIFGAKIGKHVEIYASVKIWAPWNLQVGDYSILGSHVDCYNQGKITIGANTTISQKSYLCASSHDIADPKINLILKPITIQDQVWVAADAFVGPGVTVGQGSVVGARSSVFKDVKPWTVVGGNPAVFIKDRVINKN